MTEATSITQRPSWAELSRSGKGVMVVKVKANDRSWYYIVPGTNLRIPLDLIKKSTESRFASLEALVEFTKLKPADVILMEAPPGFVAQDDAGELEAFSPAERKSLGLQ